MTWNPTTRSRLDSLLYLHDSYTEDSQMQDVYIQMYKDALESLALSEATTDPDWLPSSIESIKTNFTEMLATSRSEKIRADMLVGALRKQILAIDPNHDFTKTRFEKDCC